MNFLVTCFLFVAMIIAGVVCCAGFVRRVIDSKIRACFAFISISVSLLSLVNLLKCSATPDTVLQGVLTAFYFIPAVVILICAIIVAISVVKLCKGKNPPVLPIVIIALMLIYSVLYAMNVPIISVVPMSIINGILILLLCESCISPRLFKTGADYRYMFENSNISTVITNNDTKVLYRSKAATPDRRSIRNAIEHGIDYKPTEDFIITSQKVSGGYAVFTKEVKELNMLLDELNETALQLEKSNDLIGREKEIRLELIKNETLNSLYGESLGACAYKLNCVSAILRSLPENDKMVRNNMLLRAKMLTSYVKNKFEMLHCIDKNNCVQQELLFGNIEQAAKILESIIASCEMKIEPFKEPHSRIAMLIYDWIESVFEFSMLFEGSSLKAEIFENENEIFINIALNDIDAHKKFEADKELVRKTASYNGKMSFDIFSSRVSVKIKLPTEVL